MTASYAIFWPVIAQAALTYAIYFILVQRRFAAVKSGEAKPEAFRQGVREPATSLTARNNVANQFELPVLFYVVCIAIYVTGTATLYPVAIAWLFFASRVLHAYIHLTTNRLNQRMRVFIAGYMLTGLLWIWLAVGIATK